VVQELFLTDTAKLADVVLPALAYTEREGSYTSGERRVQRFFPALPARSDCKADYVIAGEIGSLLGMEMEARIASIVMTRLAASVPGYVDDTGAPLSYMKLSQVVEQWPIIGRGDLYYGGTTYENTQGLGIQLAPSAQRGEPLPLGWHAPPSVQVPEDALLAVPITRLYDRGQTVMPSRLLHQRIPQPYVAMNPADAGRLDILDSATIELSWGNSTAFVSVRLDEIVPANVLLVPRSMGVPIYQQQVVDVRQVERQAA
jgi:NADH-quinone oxidoreductase subunit G